VDHVAIIDHVATAATIGTASGNAPAPQCRHQRAAEQTFQPLIVQPDPQAMTDQPRCGAGRTRRCA
jgi:hypothetical protein